MPPAFWMNRCRRALCCAATLAAAGLVACAVPAAPPHSAADTAAAVASLQAPREIAPGVYVMPGHAGEIGPENRGRVGNSGFIVGDDGVVAIDAGVSYAHGRALLAAIRGVTAQPVRLLLITQTRQEFLFGTAAFREQGIPVHMHRRAAQLMAARCETCLRQLRRTLGDAEMHGTQMFTPDVLFDGSHEITATGRRLRVLHLGHSSGPGDVAVLDVATGTLFAGGLLAAQHIPDVYDSDLNGWQQALTALRTEPLQRIVPGHGPVADATVIADVQRYLSQLEARLVELLAAGTPLSEVPDRATLPGFSHWDQYDTVHRRNASVVFLRLERELLFK